MLTATRHPPNAQLNGPFDWARSVASAVTGVVSSGSQIACGAIQQYGGLIPSGAQQTAAAICAGVQPSTQAVPPVMPGTMPMPSAGAVYRYNTSRRVYVIYAPQQLRGGLGVANLAGACLYGNCAGLGQDPDPAPPAGMVKVGEQGAQPTGIPNVGTERDKPWYKKWTYWAAIGGGLAVVGGGVYLATR